MLCIPTDCVHCQGGIGEQCKHLDYDPVGRTIDRHIEEIMDKVEDPAKLAEGLCLAGLIRQTVLEDVRDSDIYTPYQKMAIMFKSKVARERLASNPQLFEEFLKILLESIPSGIEEVVERIQSTFLLGKVILCEIL